MKDILIGADLKWWIVSSLASRDLNYQFIQRRLQVSFLFYTTKNARSLILSSSVIEHKFPSKTNSYFFGSTFAEDALFRLKRVRWYCKWKIWKLKCCFSTSPLAYWRSCLTLAPSCRVVSGYSSPRQKGLISLLNQKLNENARSFEFV